MSREGYDAIEPLGGFKDKGRDAVHVSGHGATTIFAYSVREDWRAKLAEDSEKISRHGHTCNKLVFVTTSDIGAGARDEAVSFIGSQYGWSLELYGLERLRILLEVRFPNIQSNHPQIFPPDFLAIQAKARQSEVRDHLLISYARNDTPVAEWLARKLIAEGYRVWCDRFPSLGEDNYPDDVEAAIHTRVARVVALYSRASLDDADIVRQRAIAFGLGKQTPEFMIPLRLESLPLEQMDQATRQLIFLPFEVNWAEGLRSLLAKLRALASPKLVPNGQGLAASTFLGRDAISDTAETIVTNYLPVERLPDRLLRFRARQALSGNALDEMRVNWAFRGVSEWLFLSFQQPPASVADKHQLELVGTGFWRGIAKVEGIVTGNLVSELIRKALGIQCMRMGLQLCRQTGLHYFPDGLLPGNRLKYRWPDGRSSAISSCGERKFKRGKIEELYRYYLAPDFYVSQDLVDDFAVLLRIRVRISDTEGSALQPRKANSRRKHLCKDWWNGEWLSRMLGVSQFLGRDGRIVIGDQDDEQIVIGAAPALLLAPKSIDEAALDRSSYERDTDLFSRDATTDDTEEHT
jgi:hypothetical protein